MSLRALNNINCGTLSQHLTDGGLQLKTVTCAESIRVPSLLVGNNLNGFYQITDLSSFDYPVSVDVSQSSSRSSASVSERFQMLALSSLTCSSSGSNSLAELRSFSVAESVWSTIGGFVAARFKRLKIERISEVKRWLKDLRFTVWDNLLVRYGAKTGVFSW